MKLHKSLAEIYELSADEFLSWLDYFTRNPDGERDDARVALLCAITANCHSTKRRFTVGDFMPRKRKRMSQGEITTALKRMAAAMGGSLTVSP